MFCAYRKGGRGGKLNRLFPALSAPSHRQEAVWEIGLKDVRRDPIFLGEGGRRRGKEGEDEVRAGKPGEFSLPSCVKEGGGGRRRSQQKVCRENFDVRASHLARSQASL